MLDEKQGRYLVALARKAIETYLESGKRLVLEPSDVPDSKLTEKGACFTTLMLGDNLRGCIGSLEATKPLVFDVMDNALSAALEDPRFQPLSTEELPAIKIEVSVLTSPERLLIKTADELLDKLEPRRHGLIMKKGWARATFLPMVWEQLPEKEEFLSRLCMKAGLLPDEWREVKEIEFYTYEAQEFSE